MFKRISLTDWVVVIFVSLVLLASLLGCGPATLDEDLQEARSAWNVLEMCPAQVFEVDQLTLNDLADVDSRDIPEGGRIEGYADDASCTIYILMRLDWPRRAQVLQHELGHLIKGRHGHLRCLDKPGDDVMCPDGGGPWVTEPTDRDRAFVRE